MPSPSRIDRREEPPLLPPAVADAPSADRARRAFTLVEFGIVLAAIAVLASVVIYGAGYIEAARRSATVDLVLKLHAAANQFATRNNAGLSYGVDNNPANPRNVSLAGLQGAGFLPANLQTPWGVSAGIVVQPDGTTNAICVGLTCVRVVVPVGRGACTGTSNELVTSLQAKALSVTCTAPDGPLTAVFR